jgi:hypothetical protein
LRTLESVFAGHKGHGGLYDAGKLTEEEMESSELCEALWRMAEISKAAVRLYSSDAGQKDLIDAFQVFASDSWEVSMAMKRNLLRSYFHRIRAEKTPDPARVLFDRVPLEFDDGYAVYPAVNIDDLQLLGSKYVKRPRMFTRFSSELEAIPDTHLVLAEPLDEEEQEILTEAERIAESGTSMALVAFGPPGKGREEVITISVSNLMDSRQRLEESYDRCKQILSWEIASRLHLGRDPVGVGDLEDGRHALVCRCTVESKGLTFTAKRKVIDF